MSLHDNSTSKQSRRTVLRKTGLAITGLSGVAGVSSSPASAALPYNVHASNSDSGYMYYEIHVSGDIQGDSDIESEDEDHGSWVEGTLDDDSDHWDYSGYVEEVYVAGSGDLAFYTGGDGSTPEYYVDIYTDYSSDLASYIWDQDGYIYERNGSLESDDSINSSNDYATGNVGYTQDEFIARGHPSYLNLSANDVNIHWEAYNF